MKSLCSILFLCIIVCCLGENIIKPPRYKEIYDKRFKYPEWRLKGKEPCFTHCLCIYHEMECQFKPYLLPPKFMMKETPRYHILKLSVAVTDLGDLPTEAELRRVLPDLVVVANKIVAYDNCENWEYKYEEKIHWYTNCRHDFLSAQDFKQTAYNFYYRHQFWRNFQTDNLDPFW